MVKGVRWRGCWEVRGDGGRGREVAKDLAKMVERFKKYRNGIKMEEGYQIHDITTFSGKQKKIYGEKGDARHSS